jgi:hypothetical protein
MANAMPIPKQINREGVHLFNCGSASQLPIAVTTKLANDMKNCVIFTIESLLQN